MTETHASPRAESASPGSADTAAGRPLEGRALRLVMALLAFAAGASVANLYYAQPLLTLIRHEFAISSGTAALVVTLTQVGYALGLALLLPLGDLIENRKLAYRTLLVTAVALAVTAASPGFGVFLVATALVGVTSVVAQVLIPFAAHLAPAESRGKYVGQVSGGLVLGIMLARSVSSIVAAAWGWRTIYAISAVVMIATAILLARLLPRRTPAHAASYPRLVASTIAIARAEPILVRRAAGQTLMFAAFTAYWTAITFELVGQHHLSQAQIALFALVGAAGAAASPVAGRFGDRGFGVRGRALAVVLGVTAAILAGLGSSSVILLALAAVLLDFAVQSNQVLSVRDVYGLRPEARARMNSVYMTSVFAGGAVSSALTGAVYQHWGWPGACWLALVMEVGVGLVFLWDRLASRVPAPAAAA
ncbi:MAG TPA: MFS transporter [Trebonia sp.]|jgi:predicted MFS family arabinose efflux permease|nr:MFS transporter [Trebonia sp.]